MAEKRQILIEIKKGTPIRRISRELRVHRDIIRAIQALALQHGWLDPNAGMPSEADIAKILKASNKPVHELDKHIEQIRDWKSAGYNAVVIRRLLANYHECPVKIGALRGYIRRNCETIPDPVMVRSTDPGKIMDVDFGYLGYLWDPQLGKLRKAWVFSGRLRHSRKAFRRIVWKQDVPTFLMCHVYSFEHFGGVPSQVVTDNLKAAVIKSTEDNDMLNRAYLEIAETYNFMISPCLPRTPEHKGGVESDVKYIKRNFWPQIREAQRTKEKLSLEEAQQALKQWDCEVANVRQIGGLKRTPEDIFTKEEQSQLKSLPRNRWEPIVWVQCKVGRDWRITHEGSYYSVPYMLIGQTVQCRVSHYFVEIYYEHNLVAKHPKADLSGIYQRNSDHAPPFKEAVLNCSREGLLENAREIGDDVYEFCKEILTEAHIDKLRPVRKLLSLALNFEKERLNNACKRALKFKTFSYRSVKEILEKGLDFEPIHARQIQEEIVFRYARDPSQYTSR